MSGFKVGELILTCSPYAHALRTKFKNQYCDFCFKENDQLKKCSRCSFTYYCDKSCQTNAWDMHKTECKYIKKYDGEKPDAFIRCYALIIFKTKKHGIDKPFVEVDGRKISFATLMSHIEDIKQDEQARIKVKAMLNHLQWYIGSENTPLFDDIFELYGKTTINSFAIHDIFHTESLGVGLYLGASIFNHSCDPDAFAVFDGTTLNVRMRRNVSHRNIREVRISYLDSSIQLTQQRRIHLSEKYYFHCECELCTSSQVEDLMTKLVTDTEEVKEKALKCQNEFKDNKKLLKGLLNENPRFVLEECKKLLESQSNILADTNIYKVKTLLIALDACLLLDASDDLIKISSYLEKPLRLYLGNVHPELGDFLFHYGNHLCLSGFHPEGVSKMFEAGTIIKIINSAEHPSYKLINKSLSPLGI